MDVLIGLIFLIALAGFCSLTAAAFNDGFARRLSAILLARAEAREAYRERYSAALHQREREFGVSNIEGRLSD